MAAENNQVQDALENEQPENDGDDLNIDNESDGKLQGEMTEKDTRDKKP